ncbi:MAG: 5'/3'-nucleotidase SurE [Planctomycetes bacterium]|nr:5'/3'-nucleotidase SurE [Planctomycetota bacterium]
MRILLTNDDGYDAPGLEAIARELRGMGPLTIVAPLSQQSAISQAITLFRPLVVHRGTGTAPPLSVAIEGTPVDCVKLALAELCPELPEVVVSGINHGANLGVNVFYSGTVGAALEAAMSGVPGIALSLEYSAKPDFVRAARQVRDLVGELAREFAGRGTAFNVNIPARPSGKAAGVAWTRMDNVLRRDRFVRGTDPRSRPYFWYQADPPPVPRAGRAETARYRPELLLDQDAFRAGYISVTPLMTDLTHFDLLMSKRGVRAPPRRRRRAR